MGSLARWNLYDEPVEGGGHPSGEARRQILKVKVVIKVGQERPTRGNRPNQLQRLVHGLVRWVRQIAQRRDDEQIKFTEQIA
jgi:hypothetical protein